MFLIIFCLLQTIVSQQSTGGVNTIMNTTYTATITPSSTVTHTQLSIRSSTQAPTQTPNTTQSSSQTLTQTSTPTYYIVNYDSNTSTVTPTQSPTPGSMQTYNVSQSSSVSLSPSPSNLNNSLNDVKANVINNYPIMSTANIIGVVIGGTSILALTISILGYYYIKNIKKSRSPVSNVMAEKGNTKILIQSNPVLEPIQEEFQENRKGDNHIKKRWTQCVEGTDTWYVSSDGESVWVLPEGAVLENKI